MEGTTIADKRKVEKLIRDNDPDFAREKLVFYNPYSYYKTNTHIIFVHSGIEYFFKIN